MQTTEFDIHCPWHGTNENLELPVGYHDEGFEGEVICSNHEGGRNFVLRIKIVGGYVVHVERALKS